MKKDQILLIILLCVWGVLSRTVFHLGPNIEFITAISIVSGYIFTNKKIALIIPIGIMFISDMIIGNTNIFIFTWSGFLFPVLLGVLLYKYSNSKKGIKTSKLLILSEVSGITSSIFFFVWTNFGHWITTNMYTKDLNGLITCYINAIPFMKPQLAGNLIIVPLFVLSIVFIQNYNISTKLNRIFNQK